jgi:hypothetical protein
MRLFLYCQPLAFIPIIVYKECQKSNETHFYLPKFLFFSNINVIPFKIVPLGSYKPMETLFLLLLAALKIFSISVTLFWMFSKVPKWRLLRRIFKFRKKDDLPSVKKQNKTKQKNKSALI